MERLKFWNNRNVLVTGATGVVGSHITKKLLESGANVTALIRSRDPRSLFFDEKLDARVIMAYGDIKDRARVNDIVSRYEINHIIHAAAQPIVNTAILNPMETFKTNVDGTVHILEAARASPHIESVVVASSDKAYGKGGKLPYTEDMPMSGEAPYDVSKSCTDLISLSYAKTYGLPITVARFGNIYGSGDLNFNRIIPGAIKAGLKNEILEIRSDGKMIREYVHVDDVADGYLTLAENIKLSRGEAFNFGSGEKLTVLEVIERVEKAIAKTIKTRVLNTAKNEIPVQYLSAEKIRKLLGWKAKITIENGLKITVPWYEKILKSHTER